MDTEDKQQEPETQKVEEGESEKPVTITAEEFKKMQDALRTANKEAAARRKQLDEYQAAEEKRKKDEMSEVERLKLEKQEAESKAAQAEATLKAERVKMEIFAEASKAQFGDKKQKFVKPEIAYQLLTDEQKNGGDIVSALKAMAKDNPFLLEQPPTGDGVGSPKGGKSQSKDEPRVYPNSPRF